MNPRLEAMPRLGMGTWHMGENAARAREVDALRLGLDLGMALVDTAEMYGEGGAEEVVGEALAGRRGDAFVVSKFYPHNASRKRLRTACEASLRRLGIDAIDLYLLHWRGATPLAETVATLRELVADGRIRKWGVSNFDVGDMEELFAVPGGRECAANQVLYNLSRRGIEHDLLPWCAARGVDVMAYSPLDEGRIVRHAGLAALARKLGTTPARLSIGWLLRDRRVAVIPKAASLDHVRANAAARESMPDASTLAELDRMFPPPRGKQALEMI